MFQRKFRQRNSWASRFRPPRVRPVVRKILVVYHKLGDIISMFSYFTQRGWNAIIFAQPRVKATSKIHRRFDECFASWRCDVVSFEPFFRRVSNKFSWLPSTLPPPWQWHVIYAISIMYEYLRVYRADIKIQRATNDVEQRVLSHF